MDRQKELSRVPLWAVRPYEASDFEAVLGLFRASIAGLARAHYSEAACAAWQAHCKPERFAEVLGMGLTLLAESSAAGLVGFAQAFPAGHVNYLYTHPSMARRGVATDLLARLEAQARAGGLRRLETEASLVARPCFEKAGFVVTSQETVVRGGVALERFTMVKLLS